MRRRRAGQPAEAEFDEVDLEEADKVMEYPNADQASMLEHPPGPYRKAKPRLGHRTYNQVASAVTTTRGGTQ